MRNMLLGAICAMSFLVSGYTGCGENLASDLNDDIKGKVEAEFKQCASLFEAKLSIGKLAVGCFTPEEIEARIHKPTEQEVARCAAELHRCSAADKEAIVDTTTCLKELSQCEEGGLDAWEASVTDCESILSSVACDAPFTSGESHEHEAPAGEEEAAP